MVWFGIAMFSGSILKGFLIGSVCVFSNRLQEMEVLLATLTARERQVFGLRWRRSASIGMEAATSVDAMRDRAAACLSCGVECALSLDLFLLKCLFSLSLFLLLDEPQPRKTSGGNHHHDHNEVVNHRSCPELILTGQDGPKDKAARRTTCAFRREISSDLIALMWNLPH